MALIVIAFAVVAYALVSERLATTPVSAAMLFMLLGVVIGPAGLGLIGGSADRAQIATLLETALSLVLFTDSMAISSGNWRAKSTLPGRLLVIGLPLTIVIGAVCALFLAPGFAPLEALVVAICLAPTDAALGQAVVSNPRVPGLIREALNIESGLNDGLALPFFILALAAALEADTTAPVHVVEVFARSLGLAALIGGVLGWAGGRLLVAAHRRGWVGGQWAQIAALALVALVVASADRVEGSGFIAAWVAGVAFGRVLRGRVPEVGVLSEELGSLLATLSFLGFGAMLLGPAMGGMGWRAVVYAVASLTVIRMVPVAIAMVRTGLSRPTVAYVGWFGPRGLASIVFGLLLADAALPHSEALVGAVYCTVALSVILHGCSAVVGAERYATWYERAAAGNPALPESRDVGKPEVRRRLLRGGSPNG